VFTGQLVSRVQSSFRIGTDGTRRVRGSFRGCGLRCAPAGGHGRVGDGGARTPKPPAAFSVRRRWQGKPSRRTTTNPWLRVLVRRRLQPRPVARSWAGLWWPSSDVLCVPG